MRSATPDSGQAAQRDSLWVLDIGSSNHGGHTPPVFTPTSSSSGCAPCGGEQMQCGEEPKVDDAIKEIAALLAAAYERRARIRLVHTTSEPLQSTEGLANSGETSRHELTLTPGREESPRS